MRKFFVFCFLFISIFPSLMGQWEKVLTPPASLDNIWPTCDGFLAESGKKLYYTQNYGNDWMEIMDYPGGNITSSGEKILLHHAIVTMSNPSVTNLLENYYDFNCGTKSFSLLKSFTTSAGWHSCWNTTSPYPYLYNQFLIRQPFGCHMAGTISCTMFTSQTAYSVPYPCSTLVDYPRLMPDSFAVQSFSNYLSSSNFGAFVAQDSAQIKLYYTTNQHQTWDSTSIQATNLVKAKINRKNIVVETTEGLYLSHDIKTEPFFKFYNKEQGSKAISDFALKDSFLLLSQINGNLTRINLNTLNVEPLIPYGLPSVQIKDIHNNGNETFFQTETGFWYIWPDTAAQADFLENGLSNLTRPFYRISQNGREIALIENQFYTLLYTSLDGGSTWDSIGRSVGIEDFIDFSYDDFFCFYSKPSIIFSVDNGSTWENKTLVGNSFALLKNKWFRTYQSKVESSSDFGQTWEVELATAHGKLIGQKGTVQFINNAPFQHLQYNDQTNEWDTLSQQYAPYNFKSFYDNGLYASEAYNSDKVTFLHQNALLTTQAPLISTERWQTNANPPIFQERFGALSYKYQDSLIYLLSFGEGVYKMDFCTVFESKKTIYICEGDSLLLMGAVLDSSGLYSILNLQKPCSSTLEINLQIIKTHAFDTVSICEHSYLNWGNQTLYNSGTYTQLFQNTNGCDSLVMLTLIKKPTPFSIIDTFICEGNSYTYQGVVFTDSVHFTFNNFDYLTFCDSLVHLNLSVMPKINIFDTLIVMPGDTFNTIVIDSAMTINWVLPGLSTCDTLVSTHVIPLFTSIEETNDFDITIAPNPFQQDLYFYSSKKISSISVFNNLGELILFKEKPKNTEQIPTELWKNGIYWAKIQYDDDKVHFKQLVKIE